MARKKTTTISYKNNDRDKKIYIFVESQSDKSNFIKDLVYEYMSKNETDIDDNINQNTTTTQTNNTEQILFM